MARIARMVALLSLLAVVAAGCRTAARASGGAVIDLVSEIRRFESGTLAEFLGDERRRKSFESAAVYCTTNTSDMPVPFKRLRDGTEYYALFPKRGRYAGVFVVLEVRGQYESAVTASRGVVPPQSPFLRALRTGRGAGEITILRLAAEPVEGPN